MFWKIAVLVSALKLLFLHAYRSTDFEVHRNWLAITHSLPPSKWYYDQTSEWTLDYPPLFAWFECGLSQIAKYFDPRMLVITNLNYASSGTVLFQRLSVIVTDFLFIYAAKRYTEHSVQGSKKNSESLLNPRYVLYMLLICNCGLVMVDHIHFQYNGFLFGLMMMSVLNICQGRILEAAFWFSVLLNFKHIFLYIAPAYFIFMLRNYCFNSNKEGKLKLLSFSLKRCVYLGFIVLSVFFLSLGPFFVLGQLDQVITRLFPFKRGLCHAYWAPNFWALYNIADKGLIFTGKRFGLFNINTNNTASMTGGLVQEFDHIVLPTVKPLVTIICTAVSIMPIVLHTWLYPSGPRGFLRCLTLCAFSSYMFGWHVHEKAILMIIIPLALLAVEKKKDAQMFLLIATTGHVSLFPLLFTQPESPIKYSIVALYTVASFYALGKIYSDAGKWYRLPLVNIKESVYLLGLIPIEIYCSAVHDLLGLRETLPFLPLMVTSVYCAIGMFYSWLKLYYYALKDTSICIHVAQKID